MAVATALPPGKLSVVKPLCALGFVLAIAACHKDSTAPLTVVTPPDSVATSTAVVFSGGTITAQIAATNTARANGLMNVSNLGANAGMLFVFGTNHAPSDCAFWMEDTPISLSIAFIDSTMTVINVEDMAAETTTPLHEPTSACRYALETNLGWFSAHNVTAGSTVTFTLPAGTIIDP